MAPVDKESAEKKEFRMLAARAKELGNWSQAEVGRRLKVERATINGIVTGDKEPGAPLLELFRFVFFQAFPGASIGAAKYPEHPDEVMILAESPAEAEVIKKLREVHSADPEAFNTVGQVVDMAHRQLPKKPVSSDAEREAIRELEGAALREEQRLKKSGAPNNPGSTSGGSSYKKLPKRRGKAANVSPPIPDPK